MIQFKKIPFCGLNGILATGALALLTCGTTGCSPSNGSNASNFSGKNRSQSGTKSVSAETVETVTARSAVRNAEQSPKQLPTHRRLAPRPVADLRLVEVHRERNQLRFVVRNNGPDSAGEIQLALSGRRIGNGDQPLEATLRSGGAIAASGRTVELTMPCQEYEVFYLTRARACSESSDDSNRGNSDFQYNRVTNPFVIVDWRRSRRTTVKRF